MKVGEWGGASPGPLVVVKPIWRPFRREFLLRGKPPQDSGKREFSGGLVFEKPEFPQLGPLHGPEVPPQGSPIL